MMAGANGKTNGYLDVEEANRKVRITLAVAFLLSTPIPINTIKWDVKNHILLLKSPQFLVMRGQLLQ